MAFLTTSATGQVAQPVTGDASFRVFLRGSIIGSAETSLTRSDDGWLIKGTGRLAAPLDLTIRRLEVRYSADWKPQTITLELRTPEGNVVTNGTFQPDAPARIDVVRSGQETLSTMPQVAADAVIVPNLVYSAYEALAVRLMSASPGIQFPAYIVPQGEIAVRVDSVREELIQTPGRTLSTRRWQITFLNPSGEIQDDYRMVVVTSRDGRTFVGNVVAENERQITLRVVGQDAIVINKSDIQSRETTDTSMMPQGLFNTLTDAEVLDLMNVEP